LARRTGPQGRDAPSLALPLQRAGDRASLDWACHPGAGGRHVTLHWTADGLPVGVHFAGRYGEEATLLALAAELETAQPWFDRVPAL
jgi:hypothetical protein